MTEDNTVRSWYFCSGCLGVTEPAFRPFGKIAVVYDTDNKRDGISAVFVGDPTQTPFFVQGNSRTRVWGDMAVGIQTALGQRSHLSFSVRHTLGRGDLDFGSLNASVQSEVLKNHRRICPAPE